MLPETMETQVQPEAMATLQQLSHSTRQRVAFVDQQYRCPAGPQARHTFTHSCQQPKCASNALHQVCSTFLALRASFTRGNLLRVTNVFCDVTNPVILINLCNNTR